MRLCAGVCNYVVDVDVDELRRRYRCLLLYFWWGDLRHCTINF